MQRRAREKMSYDMVSIYNDRTWSRSSSESGSAGPPVRELDSDNFTWHSPRWPSLACHVKNTLDNVIDGPMTQDMNLVQGVRSGQFKSLPGS